MSGDVGATLSVLAAAHLWIGWYLGYRSLPGYLTFWCLCGLVGVTAGRIVRRVFPFADGADASLRTGVLFFALVVMGGLGLGAAGLVGIVPYVVFFAACFAVSTLLKTPRGARTSSAPSGPVQTAALRFPLPIVVIAVIGGPLLAFVVAVGLLQSPLTLYDSLSYHLLFPARWLQEHQLSIIQTPFSDPAQAYQPANGELFLLWLMVPFHGDLLARVGQLPFLLLGGAGLYAIARRIGARPEHAAYAPAFYFLARPIVEQGVGADVDLICSATFVTSLYLGIAAIDTDDRRDWALWGISLGLYLGTKYLALVYLPVLLLLPLVRGPRLKALWALPGIILCGLPWYLRNWVVAGSPIYPASLTVAGFTIARGAYTREAMNNSIFHATSVRLLPTIVAHAFGTAFVLFWAPAALFGGIALLARQRRWPGAYVLLVPTLMVPLFWFGLPVNIDSRFLLPAVAVAMVPLAFPFSSNRRWNACVHGLYLIGIVWILVGRDAKFETPLPEYMAGWLSLQGLLSHDALPLFGAFAGAAACVACLCARRPAHAAPLMTAVFGAGCIILTAGSRIWCGMPEPCPLLQISPTYIRPTMLEAWRWTSEHIHHATIAYTGNNVPYPLFGEQLTNRVYYVNIDRHASWRFHDYARVHNRPGVTGFSGLGGLSGPSAALARPSGELLPPLLHGHEGASRPRYERQEGYRDAWVQNLRALGVDHLVVSALSIYEIDYSWHNERGFPIEDDWAKADPLTFSLAYQNPQVRVYNLSRP